MEVLSRKGRTSTVYRVKQGLVCKVPRTRVDKHLLAEFINAFAVERQLLERLGTHPHIVRYHGVSTSEGIEGGLLLGEANCGDLQTYMDSENSRIDSALRREWSFQIAEAVAYVHKHGIIHMNLSTTNVLVHEENQTRRLILADFGGSKCHELSLSGGLLPDDPFSDPKLTSFNLPIVDVFGLGIIIYIINTGHYPFHEGPAPQNEERYVYGAYVRKLFDQRKFPELTSVMFGDVIAGCCLERRYRTATDVVGALEKAEGRWYAYWKSRPAVETFAQIIIGITVVVSLVRVVTSTRSLG